MAVISLTELKTLKDFYELMSATREVRFKAVQTVLDGKDASNAIPSLVNAVASLESIPEEDGKRVLSLDSDRDIPLDMNYEINELHKDIFYLEEGEDTFLDMLNDLHPGFDVMVENGRELLSGLDLNCLVTDRDGTINNYCARYLTSIQSIYNSVFISRFALNKVKRPVVLTSAPLEGLIRISTNPEGKIYYAASKGRECLISKAAFAVCPSTTTSRRP